MSTSVKKNKGGRPRVAHPKTHKCEHCDYTTRYKTNITRHYLSKHASEEERVENYDFYCNFCKVGFHCQKNLDTHNNSKGHQKIEEVIRMLTKQ